jgi:RNA polymerase sigma-32 factor
MRDNRLWIQQAIRRQLDHTSLTAERERELLRRHHHGATDAERQSALAELWESHGKLVVSIASRYRRGDIDPLDLIGAGHLGLHTAISRFDLDNHETRLSSFAIGWIRGVITDYIRRNTTVMRLPETGAHRQLLASHAKLFRDARLDCGREQIDPTEDELNERVGCRVGLSRDEVANTMRLLGGYGVVSLHAPSDQNDVAPSLANTLRDLDAPSEDDVIQRLDVAKARRRVTELADEILGERERLVFQARHVAGGDNPPTLDTIAARLGVTRERVHFLEASAKRKIAQALLREGYRSLSSMPTKPRAVAMTRRDPRDVVPLRA